jgi:hypothetical protein
MGFVRATAYANPPMAATSYSRERVFHSVVNEVVNGMLEMWLGNLRLKR